MPEIIADETIANQTAEMIQMTGETTPSEMTNQTKKKALKIELYEVTDEDMLARLDALEGHPRWYRRTPVITEDGKKIEIYHMPPDQNRTPESKEYMNYMFESEDSNYLYYNWKR